MCGVTPGKHDTITAAGIGHAVIERFHPCHLGVRWQGQGDKHERGHATHGGNVADIAGHGLDADLLRRGPVAPEVTGFHQHVRGDQQKISVRERSADDGGIIANSGHQVGMGDGGVVGQSTDQGKLTADVMDFHLRRPLKDS